MTGPTAGELTDARIAGIVAAGDEADVLFAELRVRNPSVAAARDQADELRAGRAVTVWLLERHPDGGRLDPRECVRIADEGAWREPGDPAGGLGQR